jgi:hypothetical protein
VAAGVTVAVAVAVAVGVAVAVTVGVAVTIRHKCDGRGNVIRISAPGCLSDRQSAFSRVSKRLSSYGRSEDLPEEIVEVIVIEILNDDAGNLALLDFFAHGALEHCKMTTAVEKAICL